LRAQIDQGIEEHIANIIRKLVDDLRKEYLHWKRPPPPTTDVAEEDQPGQITTHYNLSTKASRPSSYEGPLSTEEDVYSSEEGNDEEVGHAQDGIQNNRQVESETIDTAYFPELSRTIPSAKIDLPLLAGSFHGEQQPTLAHDPSPELPLDESTQQTVEELFGDNMLLDYTPLYHLCWVKEFSVITQSYGALGLLCPPAVKESGVIRWL
jgi:hypothetical protein